MSDQENGLRPAAPWPGTLGDFVTGDAPMRSCLELARVAARTELPVLILGESGTGKTLLAHAIHNSSSRRSGTFVSFNAAALSDTLLDSQLFGHERGAFTGALKRVKGKFELADRGTLFIDEIADMSAAAQAKILRAVEYGEFERLGSEELRRADVRLISATHLPLQRYVESDHFRKDLFYRISGLTLRVPTLRDRPNDLRSLIASEITAASRVQNRGIIGLSKEAADLLLSYRWPGNLRELKRVMQAAVARTTGEIIEADAIIVDRADDAPVVGVAPLADAPKRDLDLTEDLTLRAIEHRHILHVLNVVHGNKRQAAHLLGLSRSTLDRKLLERAAR
ncbi:MAG: sigma 54-interacting transcriptional regulator [Gemmatimonadota bacterium]|nr:sigma 54-interacting transcriptional regulator [Gemmatimonadota bacterium]